METSKKNRILSYGEEALHVLRQELTNRLNYMWRSKNGSLVRVKDMTTSHLVHAINMLEEYLKQKENGIKESLGEVS